MHILHIESGRHLYGGALQVRYLLDGLKAEGHKNTLVCATGSKIARAAGSSAVVCAVPMAGELDPIFAFRLIRIIRAERPDIMHVHSRRGADLWGAFAAQLTKTRAVLTRRVDNPEPFWFARAKYRFYDRVITISDGIRQVLLSEGVPAGKLACVHSALDGNAYKRRCDKEWFCREFGLKASNKVIGVVAQFIARKGHRYLIEAIPEILAHCPDARFLFLGQGPLRGFLQKLCLQNGVANSVYFAGFRSDLDRILPCLDLVIHPAIMEGLGISLLQASAAGVPIVASRVGGIPEIVHDGVNGYLIDAANSSGIIHPVLSLLQDPVLSGRFGQAGRDIVDSRFSIQAMVWGNLKIYGEVLSGKVG
jgi:glycosyltransferase involved in cell wall biosynthesis